MQLFEGPVSTDEDKQQIIDDNETNRLARFTAGKQSIIVSTIVQEGGTDTTQLINALLPNHNIHFQIQKLSATTHTTPVMQKAMCENLFLQTTEIRKSCHTNLDEPMGAVSAPTWRNYIP